MLVLRCLFTTVHTLQRGWMGEEPDPNGGRNNPVRTPSRLAMSDVDLAPVAEVLLVVPDQWESHAAIQAVLWLTWILDLVCPHGSSGRSRFYRCGSLFNAMNPVQINQLLPRLETETTGPRLAVQDLTDGALRHPD